MSTTVNLSTAGAPGMDQQIMRLNADNTLPAAEAAAVRRAAISSQTFRTTPVRVATFGDSHANIGSLGGVTGGYDQEYLTVPAGLGATVSYASSANKLYLPYIYPSAQVVCNGGISGETTAQMLGRDGNGASATRNSIQDVLSKAPDVVLFRGGSINDIIGLNLSTYATDAQLLAIETRHIQIARMLAAGGAIVIDEGVPGFDAQSGVAPANLVYVRDAVSRVNTYYRAYWANHPSTQIVFLDPVGVTCDSAGAFISGATPSTDGTHLSQAYAYRLGKAEGEILSLRFGASRAITHQPPASMASNLLGALAYWQVGGSLPSGFSWQYSGATKNSEAIELNAAGNVCARATFTSPTASSYALLSVPLNIGSGAASPNITVTSGMQLALEFDWEIETVSGAVLQYDCGPSARIDVRNSSSGRLVVDIMTPTAGSAGDYGTNLLSGHASFSILFNDVTANLTTVANTTYFKVFLPLGQDVHIRVLNPRIVRVA